MASVSLLGYSQIDVAFSPNFHSLLRGHKIGHQSRRLISNVLVQVLASPFLEFFDKRWCS